MLGQCWVQLARSRLQGGSTDNNVITTHFSKDLFRRMWSFLLEAT